jgi:hypothetical protein
MDAQQLPMIKVTEDEMVHLIGMARMTNPLNATWGTGRVQADPWVVAELCKLRGLTADDYSI